jgi:hypothetical protein
MAEVLAPMHISGGHVNFTSQVREQVSYHSKINLNGCSNPQWVRVPGLIPLIEQAPIDVPGSNNTSNGDNDTQAE